MLEGYLIDLEDESIPFVSEDNEHFHIVNNRNMYIMLARNIIEKDVVNGHLWGNRYIKMFGCRYNGRSLACQGYVYSKNNNPPDELTKFDRITFAGKAVDVFAGGSRRAVKYVDSVSWDIQANGVMIKKWDELNTRYSAVVDGIKCNIGIDYVIYYTTQWGKRDIGTCVPRFYIDFEEPVLTEMLLKIYLWVYDFMKFISFRRNIYFDDIRIYRRNANKFEETGIVNIIGKNRGEYLNTETNTILEEDINSSLGELFSYVAARRQGDCTDDLFVPDNDAEYNEVSHTRFLECALSFEGEYDRTQETKTETNNCFSRVKQNAMDVVVEASKIFVSDEEKQSVEKELLELVNSNFQVVMEELREQESSRKNKDRVTSYAKKILIELGKIDFSLEEQYNSVLKNVYADILTEYQEVLAKRMQINFASKPNLGKIFQDMRNGIGHGHPQSLEDIHVYTYQLARCMIYIMILDKVGVTHDKITQIIRKIFR